LLRWEFCAEIVKTKLLFPPQHRFILQLKGFQLRHTPRDARAGGDSFLGVERGEREKSINILRCSSFFIDSFSFPFSSLAAIRHVDVGASNFVLKGHSGRVSSSLITRILGKLSYSNSIILIIQADVMRPIDTFPATLISISHLFDLMMLRLPVVEIGRESWHVSTSMRIGRQNRRYHSPLSGREKIDRNWPEGAIVAGHFHPSQDCAREQRQ